jgi:hypothetical protein
LKPSPTILRALSLVAASLCLLGNAPAQTSGTRPAPKAGKPAAKPATTIAAPVEVPLARAEGEQLAAAALIHYGDYACEFDQTAHVMPSPKDDGYVDVRYKTQTWTMKPIMSSTGALRLEDVKGRMLALQIANKSMLMDTQIGQRVLDGCVHEKQRAAVAAAAGQPAGEALLQGGAAANSAPK